MIGALDRSLSLLQAIGAAVVAALVAALVAYLIGRAHGAASKAEDVGALKASVSSCVEAAGKAKEMAEAERKDAQAREKRIEAALAEVARIGRDSARRRDQVLATPIRGADECERTANAIADHFRSARP